jgi:Glycosyl hydrolases family 8
MRKNYQHFKVNLKKFFINYSSKILSSFLIVFILNSTATVKGGSPYFGTLPTNITQAEALAAYNVFKSAYLENCGSNIRVKWDDVSKTVSEGIGYGMLLAVYANDKASFDGLYNYYKSFLNDDGLMHWQIN